MAEPQTAVVLVHGAFADATGWQHVIPLLEREGFFVTAVQNALGSLADDIATTRRVIDAQKGAVVLVGHSYGGAVITGAAIDRPHVKALVYVAAFAPDVGDTLNGLQARFSRTELWDALVRDSAGFLYIDRDRFHDVFSKDVPSVLSRTMAAAQKPIQSAILDQTVEGAAWRTIPSWYLVAAEDRAIHPELQRFLSLRIGARATEIKSSHAPFVSQPEQIVRIVQDADRATVR